MGGRALKNTFTRRYERKEFDLISKELIDTLETHFKEVSMPLFYSAKESFGDADIIVNTTDFNKPMREFIEDEFGPNEIFHNGNCWSFDYKELQVDLITVSDETFDTNYHYLGYNDLGNFIGRIAHGLGLKYGQEGLWYEHYFKGQNIGKIEISKDYRKIFDFFELSYDKWLEGFETLENVFDYVSESKYFDYEMFQLSNLNKINRERNLKRVSYMSFLEYIEKNHKDKKFEFPSKEESLTIIKNLFPESKVELNVRKLEYEYCKKEFIKAKFNGGDVKKIFGLEGKELGAAMSGFRNYIESYFGGDGDHFEYDEYIISQDIESIHKTFSLYLNS